MTIREDIVASAAQFLQDPSVASSSIENRVSFLRTKNLTQEEIGAALTRVGVQSPTAVAAPPATGSPVPAGQPQQHYTTTYPAQYAAWQPPPPVPKRDWRDWFIMATVVGGVSYGAYALAKRYVYPLIAPPTPERLEQDKKSIEEQFDKAFSLVEQLAKDTEALKAAERERTERLDGALSDFEAVINEIKSANRRRDDEAQRIRDDVGNLKDGIPRAMDSQKDLTDQRLREINAELTSLKALISQRMQSAPTPSASSNVNGFPQTTSATAATPSPMAGKQATVSVESPTPSAAASPAAGDAPNPLLARGLGLGNTGAKASIPAWQMAMVSKGSGSSTPVNAGEGSGNSQPEASGSS
ncbi:hypothetical protein SODALDRAFT_73460 [Sodiomyces alkalinus F11]|uniref:Peroxisomal membrane protein PEX14 n=1 Tax=Sodiomyces alkalinus (strain CBS 110278 / VKM F-3762 / F11) TaxID=1314773 RepID=A0A3N2PK59_SODAK|nr:hypothetical protein SODALDRAFT_73460 [Sodiomyces alkalinus F11]ROT34905.1 hypothetical protein SODALDRAFT_73460 [Sodiomyces alkalinus F11]